LTPKIFKGLLRERPVLLFFLIVAALEAGALLTASDLHNSDPSQWSGPEVYQILNNSPWSKPVKLNLSSSNPDAFSNQAPSGSNSSNTQAPPGAGSMGRRGMGGASRSRTYGSGGGGSSSGSSRSGPAEATIQWQSALIVRMAAAKKDGQTADPASFQPLNEYVIAVIGLPITAIGGPAASADSNNTLSPEEEQRVEDHVKSGASLLRSGHEPLTATKVELDQGRDGRMLIHFPKSDPIRPGDKTVEFHLATGRTELRKKFPLKEMEYRGKLEL
jgi:hypothetical protein